jgi:hypothetical protein
MAIIISVYLKPSSDKTMDQVAKLKKKYTNVVCSPSGRKKKEEKKKKKKRNTAKSSTLCKCLHHNLAHNLSTQITNIQPNAKSQSTYRKESVHFLRAT